MVIIKSFTHHSSLSNLSLARIYEWKTKLSKSLRAIQIYHVLHVNNKEADQMDNLGANLPKWPLKLSTGNVT